MLTLRSPAWGCGTTGGMAGTRAARGATSCPPPWAAARSPGRPAPGPTCAGALPRGDRPGSWPPRRPPAWGTPGPPRSPTPSARPPSPGRGSPPTPSAASGGCRSATCPQVRPGQLPLPTAERPRPLQGPPLQVTCTILPLHMCNCDPLCPGASTTPGRATLRWRAPAVGRLAGAGPLAGGIIGWWWVGEP